MDKYLQNMKTFHILLISFFNLKALLASICLKKDYVAFQIKGFLDKRIEDCSIQQVPTHLHIQLKCTKSLCPSPDASLPSSTAPPSPDSRLTGSRLARTPSAGRYLGVRTGVHTMSGYDPCSVAGCAGVQPAAGLGGAGGGAAGGGLHLPGLGRLRAGSLGQPHPRTG